MSVVTDLTTQRGGVEIPLLMATVVGSEFVDVRRQLGLECFTEDCHHYTRGQVLVNVRSIAPAADFNGNAVVQFGADIEIVGYVAGQPVRLAVGFVNGGSPPLRYSFDPSADAFNLIAVRATQIVNGLPDSQTVSELLAVQTVARWWR